MSKTHWKKFHDPDFIGAYAFQPDERKVVTIKKATQQAVKNHKGTEQCLVVSFVEDEKPLICNVTNSKSIERVAGSAYIEDWAGVKIELFTAVVSAFGEQVEAVRVKPTKPVIKRPEMTPTNPRWAGLVQAIKTGTYSIEKLQEQFSISAETLKALQAEIKGAE